MGPVLLSALGICLGIYFGTGAVFGMLGVFALFNEGQVNDAWHVLLITAAYGGGSAGLITLSLWWRRMVRNRVINAKSTDASMQLRITEYGYAARKGFGEVSFLR